MLFAGADCANPGSPVQNYSNGKIDVVCTAPLTQEASCTPNFGTELSNTLQFASGWTPDGRALDDIRIALGLPMHPWPYVAPCNVWMTFIMQQGLDPSNVPATARQSFVSTYGFACDEVNMDQRVTVLDFTEMVQWGKMPLDKLRLVPEISRLQYLRQLRAEGYPMSNSE